MVNIMGRNPRSTVVLKVFSGSPSGTVSKLCDFEPATF